MKIIKGIFYYSGFEYIYRKAKPDKEPHPLPTLPLWLIGIYIAFFGIASQRYENRVDIIENRANSIFTQLSTSARTSALSRISTVQNYPCPTKPKIFNPVSVFRSIFWIDTLYAEMVELLLSTIEDWKKELAGVDLGHAKLDGAKLNGAKLQDANFYGANLRYASLRYANLEGVSLVYANLEGANLTHANLVGARGLTIEILSKAETLYDAKLDSVLMEEIKKVKPQLLLYTPLLFTQ
jgi:uncharacterized protein YjbI with pentapeptide repeats